MVKMKTLRFCIIFILSILTWSCEKDNEPNPIKCDISFKMSSTSLSVGEHLYISDFEITPVLPSTGIGIQKIEFFLGNKKLSTCSFPPYELDYEVPDLPEGKHLLQIDIHLEAQGFDNTTIWLRQEIEINKPQTTE